MNLVTRLGAIALASCLTMPIVDARQASPDPQAPPVKGIVQVSMVGVEGEALDVSGGNMCAAAHVYVSVEGMGERGRTPPAVTVALAGADSKPAGVAIKVNSLKDRGAIPHAPGIFSFRVCAGGLPEGVASGVRVVKAAVVKVSPESEWAVAAPAAGADEAAVRVNAGSDRPSAKPTLTLIVTPVNLQMAQQNGEAIFQFDVAASEGFTGTVLGNVHIAEPANPDGVELQEGTKGGSLSFTFAAGQKLSDAHDLMYRIRTTAGNPHGGVLVYTLSLSSVGGEVTTRNAAQEVRVKVGRGRALDQQLFHAPAVGAILIIGAHQAAGLKAVTFVKPYGGSICDFHHQVKTGDAPAAQAAEGGIHQRRGDSLPAIEGIDGDRHKFGPSGSGVSTEAGKNVPAGAPAFHRNQKHFPAFVGKICKQFAIPRVFSEAGVFNLQDAVEVEGPEWADGKCLSHSVILYFGALGGSPQTVGSKKRGKARSALDKDLRPAHTGIEMQLSVNCDLTEALPASLMDLRQGDAAILDGIDLPTEDARRLMELGFLPGTQITAGRSAPGGDPRVFQVDGSEIALRRETARRLTVRRKKTAKLDVNPGA